MFHAASPFLLPEQIKSTGTDVIKPAVEGTRNIIAGIGRAPSVERLVLDHYESWRARRAGSRSPGK